jgi:hypothetical protein
MQVDQVLRQHLPLLKALYSRYRLKPSGGGLRAKVTMPAWMPGTCYDCRQQLLPELCTAGACAQLVAG